MLVVDCDKVFKEISKVSLFITYLYVLTNDFHDKDRYNM